MSNNYSIITKITIPYMLKTLFESENAIFRIIVFRKWNKNLKGWGQK